MYRLTPKQAEILGALSTATLSARDIALALHLAGSLTRDQLEDRHYIGAKLKRLQDRDLVRRIGNVWVPTTRGNRAFELHKEATHAP